MLIQSQRDSSAMRNWPSSNLLLLLSYLHRKFKMFFTVIEKQFLYYVTLSSSRVAHTHRQEPNKIQTDDPHKNEIQNLQLSKQLCNTRRIIVKEKKEVPIPKLSLFQSFGPLQTYS